MTPNEKSCYICGSAKHMANSCDRPKKEDPQKKAEKIRREVKENQKVEKMAKEIQQSTKLEKFERPMHRKGN